MMLCDRGREKILPMSMLKESAPLLESGAMA